MRAKAFMIMLFFVLTVKSQTKPYNSDSLFAAFIGGTNEEEQKTTIDHYFEWLPLRFYDIPPYAYTKAPIGAYYLTGGMYKLYFNGVHGIRLGFESNKENYSFNEYMIQTGSTNKVFGAKKDSYLRYGYERVIGENAYGQLYAVADGIYVSSLANTTKVYHTSTFSDPKYQPVKHISDYDSTTQVTTQVSAGLLQLGLGARLFAGDLYLSAEMVWGINAYKKEEDYTANAIFTRLNYTQGLNWPSYNKTYDGGEESGLRIAFSATYLRLGLGYKF